MSIFRRSPRDQRSILIAMRLRDMRRGHPDMEERLCERCYEKVGVYPSGLRVLEEGGDTVELVCQVCHPPPQDATLVPGAAEEAAQSAPLRRQADDQR